MSRLTLSDVLTTSPAPFDQTADGWAALAEDLDNAAEQYIRATRAVEYGWPSGPASQAALDRFATVRAQVSNAYQPARRISQALHDHAEAMRAYSGQAREIVAAARSAGFQVDTATGRVSVAADPQGGPDEQVGLVGRAQRYAAELAEILTLAQELDDRTAGLITVNLPDPRTGFDQRALPPVPFAELEAQRGRPPSEVNAWWHTLTPEQQEQAIHSYPELVGWLDGLPADDRDTANRLVLHRLETDLAARADAINARLTYLRENWDTVGSHHVQEMHQLRAELDGIERQQATLGKVDATLARLGDRGLLLGFDPEGDGRAVVAVGNPDTARHTAVWVPGLSTELDDISGNVRRVEAMQLAADQLTEEPDDVSTIMWLGYDAPELDLSVVLEERSRQGGAALAPFVEGLRATNETGPHHVTAVGHSYGSTVVAEAALGGSGLRVDDIVTAGSPGMHTDHASDLKNGTGVHIDPQHVWAGSAPDDPVSETENVNKWVVAVPLLGSWIAAAYEEGHGISPHETEFGANRYHVDTSGHSAYWERGSQSLLNQARVVVGQYGDVSLDHGQRPPDWQG